MRFLKFRTASSNGLASRCRGFTLIELLVVIGIIALLISVLLPALEKAKQSAQQTQCLSNLRQLVIAAINYTADNNGDVVPSGGLQYNTPNTDTIGTVTGTYFRAWYYERVYNASQVAYDFGRGLLGPYLRTENILECPSMVYLDLPANQGTPSQPKTTYGLSNFTGVRITSIRSPSETAIFGDAIGFLTSANTLTRPVQFGPPSAGAADGDYFQGRHKNGFGCVGFFDGHGESILAQPRAISTYASYVTGNPTLYSQLQALHIGPCMPGTIDYSQATSEGTYANLCTNMYDFYFWANKVTKQ